MEDSRAVRIILVSLEYAGTKGKWKICGGNPQIQFLNIWTCLGQRWSGVLIKRGWSVNKKEYIEWYVELKIEMADNKQNLKNK